MHGTGKYKFGMVSCDNFIERRTGTVSLPCGADLLTDKWTNMIVTVLCKSLIYSVNNSVS